MQRKGSNGMGLFPIDPSKPVEIFIPDALLVPIEDIELQDGNIVLKEHKNFPEGYADWFSRYEQNYSWGAEGKEKTLAFEEGLKALPSKIQSFLDKLGLYNTERNSPEGNPDTNLLDIFSQTRCIRRSGLHKLMPIVDLVNHSPAANHYIVSEEGVAIKGMYDGEILARYNVLDPIRRFFSHGFNDKEPFAFSIRCQIKHQDKFIIVQGGVSNSPLKPCKIVLNENRLIIKQPLLGSSRSPKLPRTLFLQACSNLEGIDALELFDQIQQQNTLALVSIIKELQDIDGSTASLLRSGCLDQLAALSHHFGQRNDLLAEESATPSPQTPK